MNAAQHAAAHGICRGRTIDCHQTGCCDFYLDHAKLALTAVADDEQVRQELIDMIRHNPKVTKRLSGEETLNLVDAILAYLRGES